MSCKRRSKLPEVPSQRHIFPDLKRVPRTLLAFPNPKTGFGFVKIVGFPIKTWHLCSPTVCMYTHISQVDSYAVIIWNQPHLQSNTRKAVETCCSIPFHVSAPGTSWKGSRNTDHTGRPDSKYS